MNWVEARPVFEATLGYAVIAPLLLGAWLLAVVPMGGVVMALIIRRLYRSCVSSAIFNPQRLDFGRRLLPNA